MPRFRCLGCDEPLDRRDARYFLRRDYWPSLTVDRGPFCDGCYDAEEDAIRSGIMDELEDGPEPGPWED